MVSVLTSLAPGPKNPRPRQHRQQPCHGNSTMSNPSRKSLSHFPTTTERVRAILSNGSSTFRNAPRDCEGPQRNLAEGLWSPWEGREEALVGKWRASRRALVAISIVSLCHSGSAVRHGLCADFPTNTVTQENGTLAEV